MLANALRADLGLHETPTLSSDLRHEVTCLIAVSGKLLGELAESLQRFTSCQLILLSPLMLLADEGHWGGGGHKPDSPHPRVFSKGGVGILLNQI